MSVMDEMKNVVATGRELLSTVSGKIKEIDNRVDRIANDVSETLTANRVINYYVDPENGNDANTGASGKPFKSCQRALQLAPAGSALTIYLSNERAHVIDNTFSCYASYVAFLSWDRNSYQSFQLSGGENDIPKLKFDGQINFILASSVRIGQWQRTLDVTFYGLGGIYCYGACTVSCDRVRVNIDVENTVFGGGQGSQSGDVFQRYNPNKLSFRATHINVIRGKMARAPLILSFSQVSGVSSASEIIEDATSQSVLTTLSI